MKMVIINIKIRQPMKDTFSARGTMNMSCYSDWILQSSMIPYQQSTENSRRYMHIFVLCEKVRWHDQKEDN